MEPGTLMTNGVPLRPFTHAKNGFLHFQHLMKQKSKISYILYIEKSPKKSWGLRVDPYGGGLQLDKVLKL